MMTPSEHHEAAMHHLRESGRLVADESVALEIAKAQVHATLAGLASRPDSGELLRQAELDLEYAKDRIMHLERLLGDHLAETVGNDDFADPGDSAS